MTYNILVIDDEPAMREVFTDLLEARGHRVAAWSDQRADANLALFDRVILDIKLPSGSGWDVAKRALGVLKKPARIIITTASGESSAAVEARKHGYLFLAKPFYPEALEQALSEGDR